MSMIMAKIQRFGRIRQIHTIISHETIKPSFPTPHHLKTYNLSILDHFAPNFLMPKVFFYKNYKDGYTTILKQSLSKCLTQYYPFAGRFPIPPATYIDCNDEGVEFTEASIDSVIEDFILDPNQTETLDQLIPNNRNRILRCDVGKGSPNNLLMVQLNHFTGGGEALAVSVSHKIADGFTAARFIDHWATVTRGESPRIIPSFISASSSNDMIEIPEVMNKETDKGDFVSQRFVFPNSKLKELKLKVMAMGTTPMNPTRVELLTSLLFKCSVAATAIMSGNSKPSILLHTVNMRNIIVKNSPETAAGNIMTIVAAKMATGSGEIMLNEVIAELRKAKMEVEGLKDVQEVGKQFLNTMLMLRGDERRSFVSSSLCRFPFYDVDFGWGKPIKVMTRYPDVDDNGVIMLDTPSEDGIEALVHLQKEEMSIFEMDDELLAYVEDE